MVLSTGLSRSLLPRRMAVPIALVATLAMVSASNRVGAAPTTTAAKSTKTTARSNKSNKTATGVAAARKTSTTTAKTTAAKKRVRTSTTVATKKSTRKPTSTIVGNPGPTTTAKVTPSGATSVAPAPATTVVKPAGIAPGTAATLKNVLFIPGAGKVLDLGPNEVAKLAAGGRVQADVRGAAGLAATGTGTVLLDVTISNPGQAGKVTLTPVAPDYARPAVTASVNFVSGSTTVSRVAVPVGVSGLVRVDTTAGPGGLAVSVVGWITAPPPAGTTEASGVPLESCRLLDTATGLGGLTGPVPSNKPFDLPATGVGKVPSVGAAGSPPALVLLAVNATQATGPLDVTILPTGGQSPSLTLSAQPGPGVAGFYAVPVGTDARAAVYISANAVNVTVDVVGFLDREGTAKPGGPC
jgi:hypothetical protein